MEKVSLNSATTKSREPGAPVQAGFIPLSIPVMGGKEWQYVKECLDTGWVSSVGPFVDKLEKMMCEYVGVKHMVATTSGTAALHTAVILAGVQPNEEVITSSMSFIATANSVRYVGAWPVFIDTESEYFQMDPQKLSEFVETACTWTDGKLINKATGRRIRAIMPVHALGHPADMDPILAIARKYSLKVIEDTAEGMGVKYKGRHVGQFGDIGCFSFNGNKIITTGGGGMIASNDSAIAERAKYLTTQAKDDAIEFIHGDLGFNYRLTNVQAAMGVAQLEVLNKFVAKKRHIASRYEKAFAGHPGIRTMKESPDAFCTYWMYTVLIDQNRFGMDSRQLLKALGDQKIQARPLWQPLHQSKVHQGAFAYHCETSEKLNRDALSLPCSVDLTDEGQDRVIETILSLAKG